MMIMPVLGQDAEEGDALSMVFTPGSGYHPRFFDEQLA